MNKKIKVIDLIDKKYHNLELPKHIRINKLEYFYNENRKTYDSEYGEQMSFDFTDNVLNMEVEILEDNTEEQEKLGESWKEVGKRVGEWAKEFEQGFKESFTEILRYPFERLEDNTEEIEELEELKTDEVIDGNWVLRKPTNLEIANKVNKLIKAVNQIRKDLNK